MHEPRNLELFAHSHDPPAARPEAIDGVRQERTGWRDQAISARHRQWGASCPAVDLDFLLTEIHVGEPTALVEYKHFRARPINADSAVFTAVRRLADRVGVPFLVAWYWPGSWAFRVVPLNDLARERFSDRGPDRAGVCRALNGHEFKGIASPICQLRDFRGVIWPTVRKNQRRGSRMKALLTLALLFSAGAHAQVTYTYTGKPLEIYGIATNKFVVGTPPYLPVAISGTLVLPQRLAPNLRATPVIPALGAAQFTDTGGSYGSLMDYTSGVIQFILSTDAEGNIIDWLVLLVAQGSTSVTLTPTLDSETLTYTCPAASGFMGSDVCTLISAAPGGTWKSPVSTMPLAFDCISNSYIPASNTAHFELQKYAGAATICQYPRVVAPSYLIKTEGGWVTLASLGLGD